LRRLGHRLVGYLQCNPAGRQVLKVKRIGMKALRVRWLPRWTWSALPPNDRSSKPRSTWA